MTELRIPSATYRLQLNRDFAFKHAEQIVQYLAALGITDLFVSPILGARPGSTHGYDVANPSVLNPELGGRAAFESLSDSLQVHGLGLIQDIVPNHMAASVDNPWWMDVLENGRSSEYAPFFDIGWGADPTGLGDRILLPLLGKRYGQAIENRELELEISQEGLSVRYLDWRFPLDVKSYSHVLTPRIEQLHDALADDMPTRQVLLDLQAALDRLPLHSTVDPQEIKARRTATRTLKTGLWELYQSNEAVRMHLDTNLQRINGQRGDDSSFDPLDRLLAQQAYRLAFWQTAKEEINYRRFFNIVDLVSIHMESPQVFDATQMLVMQLVRDGRTTGLRIDHIDGLYDPLGYLERLQAAVMPATSDSPSRRFFIVVEKILSGDEPLPDIWPIMGTTGYDFLNAQTRAFVEPKGLMELGEVYARFLGARLNFENIVYERKKFVMNELFAGEIRLLQQQLSRLAKSDRHGVDLSREELSRALVEITACTPVYRTYSRTAGASDLDKEQIRRAVVEVRRRNRRLDRYALGFVSRVLMLNLPLSLPESARAEWVDFVMKWQQFTGPVIAKGLEDTALYIYNRLISMNDVGGNPGDDVASVAVLHKLNADRVRRWPHSLNATSTHDTKRSEDVRARIHVLSELASEWERQVVEWSNLNEVHRAVVRGRIVPSRNEEYLLYQTLVGVWPLGHFDAAALVDRIKSFVVKAANEAKVHTSWTRQDPEHLRALERFVERILRAGTNPFLDQFLAFQRTVAFFGAINALSQTILKIASPGIPDFYQGTELWDFSLVDPDNRRPVDFTSRIALLDELQEREAEGRTGLLQELLDRWEDGRVKLYLTYRGLTYRRAHPRLFSESDYLPLRAQGPRGDNLIAFARHLGTNWSLVLAPRLLAGSLPAGRMPMGDETWQGTYLPMPPDGPPNWTNVVTGEPLDVSIVDGEPRLLIADALRTYPVALLHAGPGETNLQNQESKIAIDRPNGL